MPKTVEKPSVAISGGLTRIFSYIDWTISRFSTSEYFRAKRLFSFVST